MLVRVASRFPGHWRAPAASAFARHWFQQVARFFRADPFPDWAAPRAPKQTKQKGAHGEIFV